VRHLANATKAAIVAVVVVGAVVAYTRSTR
jgi:hypothetical protein